jgi:hypothetical protein
VRYFGPVSLALIRDLHGDLKNIFFSSLVLLLWVGFAVFLSVIILNIKRRIFSVPLVKYICTIVTWHYGRGTAACLSVRWWFHLLSSLGRKRLITAGGRRHVSVQLTDGRDI